MCSHPSRVAVLVLSLSLFLVPRLQVLFCTLTQEQRELYRSYLSSEDVTSILAGMKNALAGIDILRKVRCAGGSRMHPPTLAWRRTDEHACICICGLAGSRAPCLKPSWPTHLRHSCLLQVCNHPDLLERVRTEGAEDYGKRTRQRRH